MFTAQKHYILRLSCDNDTLILSNLQYDFGLIRRWKSDRTYLANSACQSDIAWWV